MTTEFQTLLVLSDSGVPLYSARGVIQTLTPIGAAANLVRDINGELVDLSDNEFQKFSSNISCTDVNPPALNGVWPGKVLTVDCAFELAFKTSGGSPIRGVVSGSSRTDGDFTFYRPQMTMMVTNYQQSFDEWECQYSWSIDLEEV